MSTEVPPVITPEALRHWQGHRGLTRRAIEVDNEIHHRGQGYVLRALGVEPPPFYDR